MSKRISVKLTKEERGYYSNLFEIATNNNVNNRVEGKDGAQFFKKSGLSKDVLKNIWLMAAQTNLSWLERDEFYVALRLIALTQSNMPADEKSIVYNNPLPPLPKFDLKSENTKPDQSTKTSVDLTQDTTTVNTNNVNVEKSNQPVNYNNTEYDELTTKMLKFLKIFDSYKDPNNNLININTAYKAFESLNSNKLVVTKSVELIQVNPNQPGLMRSQFIIVMTLLTIGLDSKNNDIISEICNKLLQLKFTIIELAKYYTDRKEVIELFKEIVDVISFFEKRYNEMIQINNSQLINSQPNHNHNQNSNIIPNPNLVPNQMNNSQVQYGGINTQQSVIIPNDYNNVNQKVRVNEEINNNPYPDNNYNIVQNISDAQKQTNFMSQIAVGTNNTVNSSVELFPKSNIEYSNNPKSQNINNNLNNYNILEPEVNKHRDGLDMVSSMVANNIEKDISNKQSEIKFLQTFLSSSNDQLGDLKKILEVIQKQNFSLDNQISDLRNEIKMVEQHKKDVIQNLNKGAVLSQNKQAEVLYLQSKIKYNCSLIYLNHFLIFY